LYFLDVFSLSEIANVVDGDGIKEVLKSKFNLFHAPMLFLGFSFLYVVWILFLGGKKSYEMIERFNHLGAILLFAGIFLGSM